MLSHFFVEDVLEFFDTFGTDVVFAGSDSPGADKELNKKGTSLKKSSFSKGNTALTSL